MGNDGGIIEGVGFEHVIPGGFSKAQVILAAVIGDEKQEAGSKRLNELKVKGAIGCEFLAPAVEAHQHAALGDTIFVLTVAIEKFAVEHLWGLLGVGLQFRAVIRHHGFHGAEIRHECRCKLGVIAQAVIEAGVNFLVVVKDFKEGATVSEHGLAVSEVIAHLVEEGDGAGESFLIGVVLLGVVFDKGIDALVGGGSGVALDGLAVKREHGVGLIQVFVSAANLQVGVGQAAVFAEPLGIGFEMLQHTGVIGAGFEDVADAEGDGIVHLLGLGLFVGLSKVGEGGFGIAGDVFNFTKEVEGLINGLAFCELFSESKEGVAGVGVGLEVELADTHAEGGVLGVEAGGVLLEELGEVIEGGLELGKLEVCEAGPEEESVGKDRFLVHFTPALALLDEFLQ